MKIELNGEIKKVKIEYKNKKHISILIGMDEEILIRASNKITRRELKDILISNKKMLEKRLKNIQNNKKIWNKNNLQNEKYFKLFGENITYEEAEISNRKELEELYFEELDDILKFLLEKYSTIMKVRYNNFKINNVKSNWGSCNSKAEITFNIRLAMAPVKVIEYVVIHELSHIKYMNHSKQFWINVGKYMPDYKKQRDYLKKFGMFMNI